MILHECPRLADLRAECRVTLEQPTAKKEAQEKNPHNARTAENTAPVGIARS